MRIAIVATGTEVGKTHVACALLSYLHASNIPAIGYKPISAGGLEDAQALGRASEYVEPTYALRAPLSPHLAARMEGTTIDLERIRARAFELERRGGVLVLETAGGLFSPVNEHATNAELVRSIEPHAVVLVAPNRLGVLHDVTACVRSFSLAGVALSAPAKEDDSSATNAAEIERLSIARVLAVFPRTTWDDPSSLHAAERIWQAVSAS